MEIDKSRMMDETTTRPRTISLFLELSYDENAIYSLKEDHYTHATRGFFPSIKKLYLELEDPTEYEFASKYFLSWKHWQQVCNSRVMKKHVEEWRHELEVKLRSRGVKHMILSAGQGNYQASKWLVDRGWDLRGKGRPSKSEVEAEKEIITRVANEYEDDFKRLQLVK